MKKGKLLVLSLASVLLLSACNPTKKDDKKDDDKPQETISVTSVALNKSSLTLRVGEFTNLVATIAPENATNKGLSWESSNPANASVDQEGKVTALAVGNTVITVKTADGNKTATCNVEIKEALIAMDLTALQFPGFYKNGYATKTQNLDSWKNLANREDIDYSTYFKGINGKEEVDSADPYKIGSQNAFNFHVSGVAVDEETLEQTQIANPLVTVKLEIKGETGFEVVSEPSQYVEMSGSTTIDTFKFKSEANGKQFRLTFSGDDSRYESVSADPISIVVEVVKAYNVTTPEELVLMDNRDYWTGLDSNAADPWGAVRQSLKDASKYPTNINDIKGLVLHRSFEITSDFLPQSMKYTEAEINAYVTNHYSDFTGWLAIKNGVRGQENAYSEDQAKALLTGSTKDWVTLFYRTTIANENFIFEGNYNSIDFSKINQIYSFQGAKLEDAEMANYQDTTASHGQIFGFNYETNSEDVENQRGGTVSFSNVTFKGNGKYSSDDNYMGGLMVFKVESTTSMFNNVISYDTFMSFMASAERGEHPLTAMRIDRCKSYGSYNSMCYSWGVEDNKVTNSYFEKAGGALFLMDNVDYGDKSSDFHKSASFDSENCRFHNLATGLEPWFVQYNASAILSVIKATGLNTGYLGSTAKKLSTNDVKRKIPLEFTVDGANIVPVVNIIAINMTTVNTMENNTSTGMPLDGHFSINNGQKFSLDLKAFEASQMADPTAANYRPDFALYRQQIAGAGAQGFVFETNAGGSSFLSGIDFQTGANNGISFVPEFAATKGQPLDLSDYALMTYLKDERFKQGDNYYSLVGSDGVTIPMDLAIAQIAAQYELVYNKTYAADAATRMVSGDYANVYIKPSTAANGCYLGVMLGLSEIPEPWLAE